MSIARNIHTKMTLGVAIPLAVVVSLALLSYFFLNRLIEKGKAEDDLNDAILRTESLISSTQSMRVDIVSSLIYDTSEVIHLEASMAKWLQELTPLQPILNFEKLDLWFSKHQINLKVDVNSIQKATLDELVEILSEIKHNRKLELNTLRTEASALFRQFVLWLTCCLILGIGLSILWAYSFWASLKRGAEREAKIRNTTEEIKELYDNSPCGYFSINSDHMIEKANNTLINWLGYEKDEIVDRLHITDVLQVDNQWSQRLIEQLQEGGFVSNLEIDVKKRDGTILPAVINVNWKMRDENRNKDIRFTLFDNTERRKAEIQVNNLNKELEAFAYSVSHDLRAPLRSIQGYARILKEDHLEVLQSNKALDTVEVIIRNSSRMGQLIDDLLNFSRLNRTPISKNEVDMNSIVNSVSEEILSGYSPSVKFKRNTLLNGTCDFNLIQQVWINLLSNAVKYSSKKENPCIEVGNADDAREIIYYVKDNGAGFEMQYAHKLFGVFQRLHKDTEFPGTGVGLALVKRIIDRHDGRVWAESQLGIGSTFYFSLPKEVNGRHS